MKTEIARNQSHPQPELPFYTISRKCASTQDNCVARRSMAISAGQRSSGGTHPPIAGHHLCHIALAAGRRGPGGRMWVENTANPEVVEVMPLFHVPVAGETGDLGDARQ